MKRAETKDVQDVTGKLRIFEELSSRRCDFFENDKCVIKISI